MMFTTLGRGRLRAALPALLALSLCACVAQPQRGAFAAAEPGVPELLAIGEQLERRGEPARALVEYVKALEQDRNNAEGHYRVGRSHVALGNLETAQDAYLRALQIDPRHGGALQGLGLLRLQVGSHDEAGVLLEQALAVNSACWRCLNGLGVIADLRSDHAKAQEWFHLALAQRPDDPELLGNLGFSLYLDGDYIGARAHLERAVSLRPDYEKAWANLGLLLTRSGQYAQAVEAFEQVMDAPSARYSAAWVCMLDGRRTQAEKLLRAAIKASPTYYVAAHAALGRLQASGSDAEAPGPMSVMP